MGAEMTVSVVTSWSAKGWSDYGARFLETFHRNWPQYVRLHVVSEDPEPVDLYMTDRMRSRCAFHDLFAISPAAAAFNQRHQGVPRSCGTAPEQQDPRKPQGYNFRFDAFRFSKKVFAIAAIAQITRGQLFWVDGDVVTHAPVPPEIFARLLPDNVALSCLDRGQYHSECGFVGYNLDHPQCRAFIEAFAKLYASDEVFALGEWHDSWVFDWLRRNMQIPTHAIEHNSRSHPFVNSELAYYMDHLKGRRKEKGQTPAAEVRSSKKRALPYWQGGQA